MLPGAAKYDLLLWCGHMLRFCLELKTNHGFILQVEAQFSADVVMRMLDFLDSEPGWLTTSDGASFSSQQAARVA